MHRNQIRIFRGDVESQVRRLERFQNARVEFLNEANQKSQSDAVATSRFLDYACDRQQSVWERWLGEALNSAALLLALVLILWVMTTGGSLYGNIAFTTCLLTSPAIWLVIVLLRRLRRSVASWRFDRYTFRVSC